MDLTITPLDPVGAEVRGVRSERIERIDPETVGVLNQAWLEYGILLFRDVDSVELHLAISRAFGELEVHPLPELRAKEDPHFFPLGGPMMLASVYDERDVRVNRIPWHRDTAFRPEICKGAMLRMLEVPEQEGETLLADTAMAWDGLPDAMKLQLENLEFKATLRTAHLSLPGRPGTFWSKVRLADEEEYPGNAERGERDGQLDVRYPSVIQPAVLTHPESGRKCIFLSPTYVDFFIGMESEESDELLRYLTDHLLKPGYVYRHRWQPNDAILWDNRRFMHAGMGNRPGEPRFGLRTTLAGPTRTGRYYDKDAVAPML